MLNITELKNIHDDIEQELVELEVIMSEETINYPNFIHVFKKLDSMWDNHEKGEEVLFLKLKEAGYTVPYDKIVFAHGRLGKYKADLMKALNSGSEFKMKTALEKSGKKLITYLREHIRLENEVLYTLPEDCCNNLI